MPAYCMPSSNSSTVHRHPSTTSTSTCKLNMQATQLTLELLSLQVNHGPLVCVVGHLGLNAGHAHAAQVDLHQDLPLHQVDGHKVAVLQHKT